MMHHVLRASLQAALILAGPALGAQGSAVLPVLVQGDRFDVVMSVPSRRDGTDDATRIGATLAACRNTVAITGPDSAAIISIVPPALGDAARGAQVVVLTVIHREGASIRCGDASVLRTLLAVRGVRLTTDTGYAPDRDITGVRLRRGDAEIIPLAIERTLVRRFGPNGFAEPRMAMYTLAVDPAALAPRADGALNDVVLEVQPGAGGAVARTPLPWSALRDVWGELSPLRVAATNGSGVAPLALPAPRDAELRLAQAAYAEGRLGDAIARGLGRLAQPGLSTDDRLQARMQSGLAFAALGDTVAARVQFSHALEQEPCVELASSSPEAARALVRAIRRPAARCRAQSLWLTAARSAVLPGYGRPAGTDQQAVRLITATATGVFVTGGLFSNSQARRFYGDYTDWQLRSLTNTEGESATELYRRAESSRKRGNAFWMTAAALWGSQLVVSTVAEQRFADRLRRLQEYGSGAPRVGVAPRIGPNDVGITLQVSW